VELDRCKGIQVGHDGARQEVGTFIHLDTNVVRTPKIETSYALNFSDKRTKQIFNIIGIHFENNVLPTIANRID